MKLTPDAKGTDAARRYLTELMQKATGSNQYVNYIHHELAGDFAWNLANHLLSSNVTQDADWKDRCAALVDIYDDATNNAPEDRCYVDGAFKAEIDEARAALAQQEKP